MLILLLTSISGLISLGSLLCAQELKGEWIVTGVEVVENEMIVLSGNLTVKSSSSLTLRNVTLALNVEENGQYGISVETGGSMFIYDSNISSFTAFRFFFSVVEGKFVMKNSELRDAGWGEQFGWAEDVKKRGLYIQSDNALIDGNFISDSHSVTLHDSHNSSVINNRLMNDYGINVDHSHHNFVLNNTVYEPGGTGIGIGGYDNVISGNVILNASCDGIAASETWNNTITNNSIIFRQTSGIDHGIWLWNGVNNNTIANNTIQNFITTVSGGGSTMVGIEVVRSINNRIEGNSIEGFHQGVILSYSHSNLVANNIISNISQGVAGTYCMYIPSLDAIQLYHSSSNVVINNGISSVQSNGILLWDNASNNILQANVINSSYYGISLHYSSDNNTIVNNALSGIRSRAIILDESNGNIIYHNNFLVPVVDAYDSGLNHWDLGEQGNYWGDYEGQDMDGNGIGDSPRGIPPNGTDNSPLMNPTPVVFVPTPYLEPDEKPEKLGEGFLITTEETWENRMITSGGIEVRKGATLTLKNVTLMMWGWWGIFVEGSMYIYNSTITAVNPKYGGYPFLVSNAKEFTMRNSRLHYCGYSFGADQPGGLAIWGEPYTHGTNVTMENNVFTHNYRGVWVAPGGESSIRIVNNTISYSYDAIVSGGVVLGNTISKIIHAGIFGADDRGVRNNNISYVWMGGIISGFGPPSLIVSNIISNSEVGILLLNRAKEAGGVSLVNNIIKDAWRWAIQISQEYPSPNVVRNNTLLSCAGGIYLTQGSCDNLIYENNITANDIGIVLWNSSNNSIYHNNFVNNTLQVYTENSLNAWDDGYPSGGNYWSDYMTVDLNHGLYQDEAGGDGIGDKPYGINENNVDRYPLMVPTYTSLLWFRLTTTSTEGGTTRPTSGTYAYVNGTTASIAAIPNINYELAYWNLNKENVGSANPLEVIMVADHTLHAVFRLIMYNLTISTTTSGITDPGSGTYTHVNGTVVSVTAMPDTIHEFSYWLLDGERRTENPILVTIRADHTLEVVFQIKPILILLPLTAIATLAIVLAKRRHQRKRRNLTNLLQRQRATVL